MLINLSWGRYGFWLALHAYSAAYDVSETRLSLWTPKWSKTFGTSARKKAKLTGSAKAA